MPISCTQFPPINKFSGADLPPASQPCELTQIPFSWSRLLHLGRQPSRSLPPSRRADAGASLRPPCRPPQVKQSRAVFLHSRHTGDQDRAARKLLARRPVPESSILRFEC